jgi:hypothetical protein
MRLLTASELFDVLTPARLPTCSRSVKAVRQLLASRGFDPRRVFGELSASGDRCQLTDEVSQLAAKCPANVARKCPQIDIPDNCHCQRPIRLTL